MYFVMSDIHGCYDQMMLALQKWNPEKEKLIVLGDLIDRGPDSLLVVRQLMNLKQAYGDQVVVLKGNHDESFVAWLSSDDDDLAFYYMEAHVETVKSFFGYDKDGVKKFKKSTRTQRGKHIQYHFKKEIAFLRNLPMYHEEDHTIFVHAGINLNIHNWRDDTRCMNEIRNPFIYSSKIAPKRVFFGHTPTTLIRSDQELGESLDASIWYSDKQDKVGLDGGCCFDGGQLNAVRVNHLGCVTEEFVINDSQLFIAPVHV